MSDVSFWVNDTRIDTDKPHGMLLLDFLRKEARLVGTKEGCKEGDCGACSVMVGELTDGRVVYRPMTSCLIPVGEMHGKHVVTVEGVGSPKRLNPAQKAMVETGGSQCGYCTPGFIVSMTWYLMGDDGDAPSMDGFKRAISGNLCRCTGYGSILRAGEKLISVFGPKGKYAGVWAADDRVRALVDENLLPGYFLEVAGRLAEIEPLNYGHAGDGESADFFIGGGTDLYVQRGEEIPHGKVAILNKYPEMRGVRREGDTLIFGALTTFEEFGEHPDVRAFIPEIDHYLWLVASLQLRNRATLVGNIINASPIGDLSNLLLALDAELVMRFGDDTRVVPLKAFYKGYKQYDKAPAEIVTELRLPIPPDGTMVHFEKVSKRKALDIASANSGAKIRVEDGTIVEASITVGGVAPTPLWLKKTGDALVGQPLNVDTVKAALSVAMGEMAPISDVRGSADYKRLLARQFILSHFIRLGLSFEEVA